MSEVEFTGWGWPLPVPEGGCQLCACPPESMPMVNRGTGWCSEQHRKALNAQKNKENLDAEREEEADPQGQPR